MWAYFGSFGVPLVDIKWWGKVVAFGCLYSDQAMWMCLQDLHLRGLNYMFELHVTALCCEFIYSILLDGD